MKVYLKTQLKVVVKMKLSDRLNTTLKISVNWKRKRIW